MLLLLNAPENVMLLPLQDLERQLEDVTQQMQNSTESVRIRELESERRLAEERIAELEGQLAGDTAPTQPPESGMLPECIYTQSHVPTSASSSVLSNDKE